MITSLIEVLELPNFGHITKSTKKYESRDKILLMTSLTEIITSLIYFKLHLFYEGLE